MVEIETEAISSPVHENDVECGHGDGHVCSTNNQVPVKLWRSLSPQDCFLW